MKMEGNNVITPALVWKATVSKTVAIGFYQLYIAQKGLTLFQIL